MRDSKKVRLRAHAKLSEEIKSEFVHTLEATKAFAEALEFHLGNLSDEMTKEELESALEALEECAHVCSTEFSRLKQMAEKLIWKPPLPISITFEKIKQQLKRDLNMPKDILQRTGELIEEYQPHRDEHVESRKEHFKLRIERGTLHIFPMFRLQLPKHLRSDMITGACLYFACKEKGVRISQSQIAKVLGHRNTSALSRAVREIRTKLEKSI